MDREGYARLLSAQGFPIIRAAGELWVEKRGFFLESIPPHRRIHIRKEDTTRLLLRGYAALRYSCSESEGRTSYEYVLSDKDYRLEKQPHKVRSQTRKGLRESEVRRIDFDLLADQGCAINRDVFERQHRVGPPFLADESRWRRYMRACGSLDDLEPWGCFIKGRLCAYLLGVFVDDYAYSFHGFGLAEVLSLNPMNALFTTAFSDFLKRPTVNQVSFGLESFNPMTSLDHFKQCMGFQKKSIGRNVLVNPLLRPLFNSPFEKAAQWFSAFRPLKRPLDDYANFSRALRKQYGESRSDTSNL